MKIWSNPEHIYYNMGLPPRHQSWTAAWDEIWGSQAVFPHGIASMVNVDLFFVYYEEEIPDE